ncbi:hypothetical protein F5883DRAFT_268584 [Diaporthe sp. PMI_573]|nr:hypothetical protein F5883DRAFT_268584 [Diaporthaceae sp. PMI_573]
MAKSCAGVCGVLIVLPFCRVVRLVCRQCTLFSFSCWTDTFLFSLFLFGAWDSDILWWGGGCSLVSSFARSKLKVC